MTALNRLSKLLQEGRMRAAEQPFNHTNTNILDHVIRDLGKLIQTGTANTVPEDLQQIAVHRFWDNQRLETLKDARFVSFGLCLPSSPNGPCIMEDRQRFQAVLDKQNGVEQWINKPRMYRRCYQGLIRSYFTYNIKANNATQAGKQNWGELRNYLKERASCIRDEKINPDWVNATLENQQLFGENPCDPYSSDVLLGNKAKLDHLSELLGIVKGTWFWDELILSQVQHSTTLSHKDFVALIHSLLKLLSEHEVLRDQCLILMLNKYARSPQQDINAELRDSSVDWWGNPWLPSNETRWGGVTAAARDMVSVWLTSFFIEAFFTKLAQDGVGDSRRAKFWLRYVKSMKAIQFALGSTAMNSKDRDFVALRKTMKGLYTTLKTPDSENNAFIMTLGNLVAVEFGAMGNALYGYDSSKTLQFNLSTTVGTSVNAKNSLKHSNHEIKLGHQDGIHGYRDWENRFEAELQQKFGIYPDTSNIRKQTPLTSTNNPPSIPDTRNKGADSFFWKFNKEKLLSFTRHNKLIVEDNSSKNGNIWVRTGNKNIAVNTALSNWGFQFKPNKGWWK